MFLFLTIALSCFLKYYLLTADTTLQNSPSSWQVTSGMNINNRLPSLNGNPLANVVGMASALNNQSSVREHTIQNVVISSSNSEVTNASSSGTTFPNQTSPANGISSERIEKGGNFSCYGRQKLFENGSSGH